MTRIMSFVISVSVMLLSIVPPYTNHNAYAQEQTTTCLNNYYDGIKEHILIASWVDEIKKQARLSSHTTLCISNQQATKIKIYDNNHVIIPRQIITSISANQQLVGLLLTASAATDPEIIKTAKQGEYKRAIRDGLIMTGAAIAHNSGSIASGGVGDTKGPPGFADTAASHYQSETMRKYHQHVSREVTRVLIELYGSSDTFDRFLRDYCKGRFEKCIYIPPAARLEKAKGFVTLLRAERKTRINKSHLFLMFNAF